MVDHASQICIWTLMTNDKRVWSCQCPNCHWWETIKQWISTSTVHCSIRPGKSHGKMMFLTSQFLVCKRCTAFSPMRWESKQQVSDASVGQCMCRKWLTRLGWDMGGFRLCWLSRLIFCGRHVVLSWSVTSLVTASSLPRIHENVLSAQCLRARSNDSQR